MTRELEERGGRADGGDDAGLLAAATTTTTTDVMEGHQNIAAADAVEDVHKTEVAPEAQQQRYVYRERKMIIIMCMLMPSFVILLPNHTVVAPF